MEYVDEEEELILDTETRVADEIPPQVSQVYVANCTKFFSDSDDDCDEEEWVAYLRSVMVKPVFEEEIELGESFELMFGVEEELDGLSEYDEGGTLDVDGDIAFFEALLVEDVVDDDVVLEEEHHWRPVDCVLNAYQESKPREKEMVCGSEKAIKCQTRPVFSIFTTHLALASDIMERFLKMKGGESSTKTPDYVDVDALPSDHADRKPISAYNVNQRDEIRRAYILRAPCQPRSIEFPQKKVGKEFRRFGESWYDAHPGWLEYSIKNNRVYCLCCYLFRGYFGGHKGTYISQGYNNWKKPENLTKHEGDVNSLHNKCLKKCDDLVNEKQSIGAAFGKGNEKQRYEYRLRLGASTSLSKKFLNQGLSFRGHDESKDSLNKGNFLEILELIGELNEALGKVILGNAPGNSQMTSPKIQQDLKHCFAQEVLKQIFEDLGEDYFSLLVDESSDVSKKEQMAVVIRYVNKDGVVKERFIGLVHVKETSALTLKTGIDDLFCRHGLILAKIRGQGYDGASNMSGEFNGLRALILKENVSAFYIHCFAHQLQLVVVAVANKHTGVWRLFETVGCLTNVVCASCKQQDMLRESQKNNLKENLATGSGLNQELSLSGPGDTRWNSHYKTLSRLVTLYSSFMDVLEYVEESSCTIASSKQADGLQSEMKKYDFVFYLHLMMHILEITNSLSQSLQRKEQDLVNAVSLVSTTKRLLEKFRLEGFNKFFELVNSFCDKYELEVVNMDDEYINPKRPRQKTGITNRHYYEYECFNTVLDLQIQEFENRFNEVTSDLLVCMSTLSPCGNFSLFNIPKLQRLAEMYPNDFDEYEKRRLSVELESYIDNVKADTRFANFNGLSSLVRLMVETKKHLSFTLLYRLLKLELVLPVATATVERCFSGMKFVKYDLRNRMGDENLSDSLICYIEKDLLRNVSVDDSMTRFQKMKTRRERL
ncbi:uncharacterized protein LOC143598651 [Bidens hawaiensis]|uniref:uncharacterized protein LOC143598651 n=1 Tax=Bidens hawaiensis TaxID=980011 RepID=UPI004049081C